MYLLDTNVISELRNSRTRNAKVFNWVAQADFDLQYISAVTLYELEIGTRLMERRDPTQGAGLRSWLEVHVRRSFQSRILPVSEQIVLLAATFHIPNPRNDRDALIAATAVIHGMSVVTRNVRDFEGTGVRIVNPWES
jgi:predicted nucleic acid-binding protein